jgi:hypothetical protein
MRLISLTFAGLGLTLVLAGSPAAASDKGTDMDFLRANRCRGLAAGLASDTASFDAYIKYQDRGRMPVVIQLAGEEQDKARREARNPERAAKAQSELADLCQAYRR